MAPADSPSAVDRLVEAPPTPASCSTSQRTLIVPIQFAIAPVMLAGYRRFGGWGAP